MIDPIDAVRERILTLAWAPRQSKKGDRHSAIPRGSCLRKSHEPHRMRRIAGFPFPHHDAQRGN